MHFGSPSGEPSGTCAFTPNRPTVSRTLYGESCFTLLLQCLAFSPASLVYYQEFLSLLNAPDEPSLVSTSIPLGLILSLRAPVGGSSSTLRQLLSSMAHA